MIKTETYSVANGGTTSNGMGGNGYRLVGLDLPTLTSTTIEFEASADGGSTWRSVHNNTGTTAAHTLGAASTGGKTQAVPDDVARLSAVALVRLKVAAQGAARSIPSFWERVAT